MKKIAFLLIAVMTINTVMAQLDESEKNAAIALVTANHEKLGLNSADLKNFTVSSTYADQATGIRYVYLVQTYLDIPVYNQVQVIAFKNGQVISNAADRISDIDQKVNTVQGTAVIAPETAVQKAIADRKLKTDKAAVVISSKEGGRLFEFGKMGVSRENITARLLWVPDGKMVRLAWEVYIIPVKASDYWLVRIDALNGKTLGVNNLTVYCSWDEPAHTFEFGNRKERPASKSVDHGIGKLFFDFMPSNKPVGTNANKMVLADNSSYRVIPFPYEAPSFMPGPSTSWHTVLNNPWTAGAANATTLKWHSTDASGTDYDYTRGNNVWAYQDRASTNTGSVAKSASSTTTLPNLTFDFTPDYTQEPTVTSPPNQQFAITNLFYWNNIIHDIMYNYGFTEAAGNFQDNNLGRGGLGNDHVNAEAQDGSGSNNANFATPVDGSSGRMQMYLFTSPTPDRDGDLDNGVVVHEFGHGISNRLTGGPSNSSCLSNAEQMGEGWSDYYGLMFTQDWVNSNVNSGFTNPRPIGTYVLNQATNGAGIRTQKYCTDFSVNNLVYSASLPSEVHDLGEIWCATLWDMTWNIIQQENVINPNLYDLSGGGGNTIALKLVTEGLKLQPCSPGFITARDAIITADINLYGGVHVCAIKEAFRRRGMGVGASQGSSSSVTDQVPSFKGETSFTLLQNNITSTPEGQNITYINRVITGPCDSYSNYVIRDTLPANVFFVSATAGGTYDAANRVVSWTINQASNLTQDYNFVVHVKTGSYYPTVELLNETVAGAAIPASWTASSTTSTQWVTSTTQSHSATRSFFSSDIAVISDQILATTSSISLPATPMTLSFWHYYNSEATYDGGVVEISTNGGGSWSDVGAANYILNGYNANISPSYGSPIASRPAFSGNSGGFLQSKVSLGAYVNQPNVKLRWRFGSDNGVAATGWYVDDILLQDVAHIDMRSSLFNAVGTRVTFSDSTMIITAPVCVPLASPAVTITQPACSVATGSIVITDPTAPGMRYSKDDTDYSNTDGSFSGLTPGSYNITAMEQTGCISNVSVITIDPQPLTPGISLGPVVNNTCHLANTGSATAIATVAPQPFTFTIAGPTVNATGLNSGVFTALTAGDYTITATSANGCSNSVPVTITEPPGPSPDIALGADYTSNFFVSNGEEHTIVYNVTEVAGSAAGGDTIRIVKVPGFDFVFYNAATSVTIGSTTYQLDNSRWKLDSTNPLFVSLIFDPGQNSATGVLYCSERIYVSINIKRNTVNASSFSTSARLRKANQETALLNNLNTIVFSAE